MSLPMKVSDAVVEVAAKAIHQCRNEFSVWKWELLPDEQKNSIREEARAALEAALPLVLGEPVAWQRRYGNDRYTFANGTLWSDWNEWVEDERPAMSGQWTNEYRQVYAPKEQQP